MCGIVGILGRQDVAPQIVDALSRLEYRGYDSAGVATLDDGKLNRRRAEGKLHNLSARLNEAPLSGHAGIGHTRWATHGAPTEKNAHPHFSPGVAVVHNGIIENFRELGEELARAGVTPTSETDTEIVAHLVTLEMKAGKTPHEAVAATLKRLKGAFALAFLFAGHDDLLIGARHGPPLAVGHGGGEMYLGSDAIALAPLTSTVTYLEDGDMVVLNRSGAEIFDAGGKPVHRAAQQSVASAFMVDKGNYRHYMLKEILEQPEVIGHTLAHYADLAGGRIRMPEMDVDFAALDRLTICACGTAFYAGLVAKYWFERVARLPVDIDIASEFRYRQVPLTPGGLALFISQSGETADTLAALQYCKDAGQKIGAVVNVAGSSIARAADVVFPTFAGPEIGVASTKAFTCQLMALATLVIFAARARGTIDDAEERRLVGALAEVPRHMRAAFRQEHAIEDIAHGLTKVRDVLFLGRGTAYPLAMEGALKLKEISYLHAEGYAAGELKHGPIALVDETVPVIFLAPSDDLYDKTISNMAEVAARGGQVILISEKRRVDEWRDKVANVIELPDADPFVMPIVAAAPVQLLAYHTAVLIGTDVDQPRNLAKSVTVE
ncbi:Glutamine--fructose-6-phosphate aminotransferase [isomerizing] [hydrothermal vent metagenome]|uniref:Glutamine--fructose-6-phosphate aminotransferase [isomerizing] n=1 Tax=hydrothermal vent metagenome TaxID=652676 RepID=A0A3B0U0Z8_9ZZZZ